MLQWRDVEPTPAAGLYTLLAAAARRRAAPIAWHVAACALDEELFYFVAAGWWMVVGVGILADARALRGAWLCSHTTKVYIAVRTYGLAVS